MELVKDLKKKGHLKNKSLEKAFSEISREDFVLDYLKESAFEDVPLPIGSNQTISQPAVVAFMLDLLSVKEGDKVLDIGSGSGWTTALLGNIVKDKGRVIGIERIPELKEFAEKNISKYNLIAKKIVEIHLADGYQGFISCAPYDKILVSAALSDLSELPQTWKKQLVEGGLLVVPINNFIYKFVKKDDNLLGEKYYGFTFVPLIKDNE